MLINCHGSRINSVMRGCRFRLYWKIILPQHSLLSTFIFTIVFKYMNCDCVSWYYLSLPPLNGCWQIHWEWFCPSINSVFLLLGTISQHWSDIINDLDIGQSCRECANSTSSSSYRCACEVASEQYECHGNLDRHTVLKLIIDFCFAENMAEMIVRLFSLTRKCLQETVRHFLGTGRIIIIIRSETQTWAWLSEWVHSKQSGSALGARRRKRWWLVSGRPQQC